MIYLISILEIIKERLYNKNVTPFKSSTYLLNNLVSAQLIVKKSIN